MTAWYLLAPDTIDETMATLLERKRSRDRRRHRRPGARRGAAGRRGRPRAARRARSGTCASWPEKAPSSREKPHACYGLFHRRPTGSPRGSVPSCAQCVSGVAGSPPTYTRSCSNMSKQSFADLGVSKPSWAHSPQRGIDTALRRPEAGHPRRARGPRRPRPVAHRLAARRSPSACRSSTSSPPRRAAPRRSCSPPPASWPARSSTSCSSSPARAPCGRRRLRRRRDPGAGQARRPRRTSSSPRPAASRTCSSARE